MNARAVSASQPGHAGESQRKERKRKMWLRQFLTARAEQLNQVWRDLLDLCDEHKVSARLVVTFTHTRARVERWRQPVFRKPAVRFVGQPSRVLE